MRTWVLVLTATLLGVAFVVVLRVVEMGAMTTTIVSNSGQLAAAMAASVGCAVAARRTTEHRRLAWRWLAAGTGAWAAGQAVWSYYEVALAREVPFPSLADLGFLLFPLLSAVGLVTWLGTQSEQLVARGRDLLDGVIIALSLLVLSWVTTLGSVVADGASSWWMLVLSLAYPVGDLVLATLVLLALARGRGTERLTLALLALGLGGLAVADSAFVYLTSQGSYSSADLVSSGWVIGFAFVAVSGLSVATADTGTGRHRHRQEPTEPSAVRPSLLRLALPYVPLLGACAALLDHVYDDLAGARVELFLGVALIGMVLTRQFLAMQENQRLLLALADARDQLEHQALHDALTGLANRVLFADRLDRALLRPRAEVSVLFCDLDDFKLVNDDLGHDAGDALLRVVAERLLGCVRATDTVARLGGDEFAILLEQSSDAFQVAERVVAAMQQETLVLGHAVHTSISVGIAHHLPAPHPEPERRDEPGLARTVVPSTSDLAEEAEREAAAALLVRQADTAMYAAKGAGKSRAVLADVRRGH